MIIQLVQADQSYVSLAIQFDKVPHIPVMLTVQFLTRVLAWFCTAVAHGSDSAVGVRFRTVEVPQIQSVTELNNDLEAGLAHFSDSPERG